ncbi:MAG: hypothetical protein PVG39_09195 [Desulfobacteraceae bacterium]|jgi:hypothetical protein
MKMEITVPEVMNLINEIRREPDSLFEMIRANVQVKKRELKSLIASPNKMRVPGLFEAILSGFSPLRRILFLLKYL